MSRPYPKATFALTVAGRDFSDRFRPRLSSATLTEARGEDADQLDLVLSDEGGDLALPKKGVGITFALGWIQSSRGLVDKGRFTVDEVEHSGTPDVLTIRARSADFTDALRIRKERSWRDGTVKSVLQDVAAANGLQLRIAPALASQALPVLDQSRESDAALLARLGRRFGAAATVKAGRLLFLPIGAAQTASGGDLTGFALTRADGDRHSFKAVQRDAYSGAEASWHDSGSGARHLAKAGDDGHRKRLRRVFGSQADAQRAAAAEHAKMGREKATLSYTLALGRPDLYPEARGTVRGVKAEIDAVTWLIERAVHTLNGDGGLQTTLELETAP